MDARNTKPARRVVTVGGARLQYIARLGIRGGET